MIYRAKTIALFLICMLFFASCSRKITENQNQLLFERAQNKQEKLDRLQSAREDRVEIDKNYLLYFNNGTVAHNSGDYSKAIELFNESLKLNPNFAEAWGMKGFSKYKAGDTPSACKDWKKSLQLGNTNVQSTIDEQCQ
ncbi:MAG: tetratricopeptide repeat protein [Psychroserpens sp.]|uniref:tetratricopeptide repeat protein n=1 Tax=Psychroserpens sp. TaxID=2020870 RepID=UPI0030025ED2